MKILIFPNTRNPLAMACAEQVETLMAQLGHDFVMFSDNIKLDNLHFAVAIGGDGTILRAAHILRGKDIPIIGINTGRLGFLTTLCAQEYNALSRLFTSEFIREDRLMLRADITGDTNGKGKSIVCLNEFVFAGDTMSKTVNVSVLCDDVVVMNYRGDGVIIATPTGSTAYSLSGGGPILDTTLNAFVVTPLCAHSLGVPPVVISAGQKLTVKTSCEAGSVKLCADGMSEYKLTSDVTVSSHAQSVPLIFLHRAEQFTAIEDKLRRK